MRAELRGLPQELADKVGAHLVAAGMLIDEDPELAYAHAEAARRRASRLPIIREAAAETAYAAGEFAHALGEFRALRRMTGSTEYLHVMADCERALGRPDEALQLIRESERTRPSVEQAIELRLVEAGARSDLGQRAESLRLLKTAIEEFSDAPAVSQARLRFAYAEALLERGHDDNARRWLETAVRLDPADESGAGERLAELDGMVLDVDFSGDEDEDDDRDVESDEDQDDRDVESDEDSDGEDVELDDDEFHASDTDDPDFEEQDAPRLEDSTAESAESVDEAPAGDHVPDDADVPEAADHVADEDPAR